MDTCRTCDMPLIRTGRPGRPAAYCDDDCRIKGGVPRLLPRPRSELRRSERKPRTPRKTQPCSECAKPMQVTRTSAVVMTCLPCRRARKAAALAARDVGPWERRCSGPDCGTTFVADRRSRRFCSQDCLVNNHRALERIRDAERRRNKQAEMPTEALAWQGCFEANYLIAGPPESTTTVKVRTTQDWHLYDIRCPGCDCLCVFLTGSGDPGAWGCHRCYRKYALLSPPPGLQPADYGLEAMASG